MYGCLSKTNQSLALKLMATYTLKSNILVYFYHLKYLLVLARFISLYFHFCETALNSYYLSIKVLHSNSLYIFSPFRIKLLFGTPSKLLSKTRLIRDIYLATQICFGHRTHSTKLPHFRTYQIYLFTAQSHVIAHQRDSQAVNVNHPDLVH